MDVTQQSPVPQPPGRGFRDLKRVRVTRACDRCKKRKIRCTGLQPCRICIETHSRCAYDTAYSRGRQSTVAPRREAGEPAQAQQRELGASAVTIGHDNPTLSGSHSGPAGNSTPSPTDPASRASPEPVQTDLEGHYVGPSSGVSFLLRVQKRLHQFVSFPQGSSIFTFGDAPLPSANLRQTEAPYFDPTFSLMLAKGDTTRLVQRFFEFAVPVDRFLHQPTIEAWLEEFHESMGAMHTGDNAPARTAVLFMVFAVAQGHLNPVPTAASADMSLRYFLAANQQLTREQGTICLASVQARLCQCLWLLSESRINHCWSLFGTVARLACAIGLHRKRYADPVDHIEIECRRRTFWSAYALDNYLSTALGRPRTFHDDDIDQELPTYADDHEIFADRIARRPGAAQSVIFGPVAYAKLSRILSKILRNIYSIHPMSRRDRHAFATKYTEELKEWRTDVSHFLGPDTNTAPLIPIFQRQKNVLNLAYWHTVILTHRPFLLRNFSQLRHSSRQRHHDNHAYASQMEESIRECLQAALNIANTVNNMFRAGQFFRAYWLTSYFAFSAAVILYVYTIQQSNEPEDTYQNYLAAATRCLDQLSGLGEDGSLAARYCLVLEELRKEAMRQMEQPENSRRLPAVGQEASALGIMSDTEGFAAVSDGPIAGTGLVAPDMAEVADIGDFYVTPNDSLAESTSWDQFESMVSASGDGILFNLL